MLVMRRLAEPPYTVTDASDRVQPGQLIMRQVYTYVVIEFVITL